MERHKIIELMGQLKLAGMRAAGACPRAGQRPDPGDEAITAGLRAQHPVQRIIGELLLAQLASRPSCAWPDGGRRSFAPPRADNRARSTAYRMGVARFPVMKNLAEFDFSVSPVNQGLVRELPNGATWGGFLATQRNAVLIGGTALAS